MLTAVCIIANLVIFNIEGLVDKVSVYNVKD